MAKNLTDKDIERQLTSYQERDGGDDDWMRLLSEVNPEMVARFEEVYEAPKFLTLNGLRRICGRCGCIVHRGSIKAHKNYHKRITFGLWAVQGLTINIATHLNPPDIEVPE